jgi:glycosyl transferase family 11
MTVTIQLAGGCGNQLFQFALGLALEAKGRAVQYDVSAFDSDPARRYMLGDFGLNLPTVNTGPTPTMRETSLLFDPAFLDARPGAVLAGYFQSEKYFSHLRNYLRGVLFDKMFKGEKTQELALKIAELGSSSCFVHVRRSDNLRPTSTLYQGLTDPKATPYYREAIRLMFEKNAAMNLFVFSDDPKWLAEYKPIRECVTVVSHNAPSFTERSDHNLDKNNLGREVEDLYLMSLCRHAIIANSTFSFWGAWLGRSGSLHGEILNDRIITAPDPWYSSDEAGETEIIPDSWIKVPVK